MFYQQRGQLTGNQNVLLTKLLCFLFVDESDDGDVGFDLTFDLDDDEDGARIGGAGNSESLEEDGLWNLLCTYTITQKKFMNQHW